MLTQLVELGRRRFALEAKPTNCSGAGHTALAICTASGPACTDYGAGSIGKQLLPLKVAAWSGAVNVHERLVVEFPEP